MGSNFKILELSQPLSVVLYNIFYSTLCIVVRYCRILKHSIQYIILGQEIYLYEIHHYLYMKRFKSVGGLKITERRQINYDYEIYTH